MGQELLKQLSEFMCKSDIITCCSAFEDAKLFDCGTHINIQYTRIFEYNSQKQNFRLRLALPAELFRCTIYVCRCEFRRVDSIEAARSQLRNAAVRCDVEVRAGSYNLCASDNVTTCENVIIVINKQCNTQCHPDTSWIGAALVHDKYFVVNKFARSALCSALCSHRHPNAKALG